MESKRRRFTSEFRHEAVALAASLGNVAQAARDLGIGANALYRWKDKAGMDKSGKASTTQGRKIREDEELRQLRKENAKFKLERDFLKKAAAFFAQQSPNDTSA